MFEAGRSLQDLRGRPETQEDAMAMTGGVPLPVPKESELKNHIYYGLWIHPIPQSGIWTLCVRDPKAPMCRDLKPKGSGRMLFRIVSEG